MSHLRGVSYASVRRLLQVEFECRITRGASHDRVYRDLPNGRRVKTVIARHRGDIPQTTLKKMLRELAIDAGDFQKALGRQ